MSDGFSAGANDDIKTPSGRNFAAVKNSVSTTPGLTDWCKMDFFLILNKF
jgi:hypothetical protein